MLHNPSGKFYVLEPAEIQLLNANKNAGINEFCDGKFGKLFIENDVASLLHIIKYIFIPGYINFLIEIIKP